MDNPVYVVSGLL